MQPPKGKQRGVRVVEGARLESVYTGNRIEGSNPFLSAVFPFGNRYNYQLYLSASINVNILARRISGHRPHYENAYR